MNQVKRGRMCFFLQSLVFLSYANKFKKDDAIQVIFLEDLMLFMIKGLMPMRTI
jgi:hypothetical protein